MRERERESVCVPLCSKERERDKETEKDRNIEEKKDREIEPDTYVVRWGQ